MRKACLVVSGPYLNGQIFNKDNHRLNRDNCLAFFHDLQDEFRKNGVDLNTQDIHAPNVCDFVIYNEMPAHLPSGNEIEKSYLLLFESELIRPDNWNLASHQKFTKIFTWHDDFVDNKKYFKMNFTHTGQASFLHFAEKSKFCTLIAGDKAVSHPLELYSQRRKAIRWFEKNHPNDFEFFGVGWDRFTFKGPKLVRAFNKFDFLRTFLAEKWPSYKGKVDSKLVTLRQYKFSICYENAHGIPGYITEKIFDSMAAGCIPIYWGAPNISRYVPDSCYIDQTKFGTYEELYDFLVNMSPQAYDQYLQNIQTYLSSATHQLFVPKYTAESVARVVLGMMR